MQGGPIKTPKYSYWKDDDGDVWSPVDLHVGPVPIAQWRAEGVAQGARAMLVVWDLFPFPPEPYPVFIAPDEDIAAWFAAFDGVSMQRVSAVYLLKQNLRSR